MNVEKEQKLVNEYLELADKYLAEGNKEKAREYLKKANQKNTEIFECVAKETKSFLDKPETTRKDIEQ